MPQIAVVLLSVFLGLKDFFKTKDGSKVRNVLLGVAVYFIVDIYIRKQKTKLALENAANDPETSFAIRLHDAINPLGVSWLNNWFGDGTDEAAIQQIATEMQLNKNFDKVALKFRTLYGQELATELEKDGVYQLFIKYYTVTTTGGGSGTIPNNYAIGQAVYFKASNWNIRSNVYPNKPIRISVTGAKAGYVVANPVALKVQNNDGTFTNDVFILLKDGVTTDRHYVSKNSLK